MGLGDVGHLGIQRNTTEHLEQECSGKKGDWIFYQIFKLDSVGEGDGVLYDKERPGNSVSLGNRRENP